jgi:hypothetical protein
MGLSKPQEIGMKESTTRISLVLALSEVRRIPVSTISTVKIA